MRRTTTIVTIALVISAVATVPLTGAAIQGTDTQTTADGITVADRTTNNSTTEANVTPGGQLMGVIGIQQSQLNGTMAEKTFGVKIAQADSNESKAAVVGEQVTDLKKRLKELRDQKKQLRKAHKNGSLSTSEFQAEMAELAVETQNVRQLANATGNASAGLPESLLAEKGINVTAIQTLKNKAANLTGPQVAQIARSIAGPSINTDIAEKHRPDDPGSNQHGKSENRRSDNKTTARGNQTAPGTETTTRGNGTSTGTETTTPEGQTTTTTTNEATDNETTTSGGQTTTTTTSETTGNETTTDGNDTTTTTAESGQDGETGSGNSGNTGSSH